MTVYILMLGLFFNGGMDFKEFQYFETEEQCEAAVVSISSEFSDASKIKVGAFCVEAFLEKGWLESYKRNVNKGA